MGLLYLNLTARPKDPDTAPLTPAVSWLPVKRISKTMGGAFHIEAHLQEVEKTVLHAGSRLEHIRLRPYDPGVRPPAPAPDSNSEAAKVSIDAASVEPSRKTLPVLGFVVKPDGAKEVIVAEGHSVAFLREGETYQDDYTVAAISEHSVELVQKTPEAAPWVAAPPIQVATVQRVTAPNGLGQARQGFQVPDRDGSPNVGKGDPKAQPDVAVGSRRQSLPLNLPAPKPNEGPSSLAQTAQALNRDYEITDTTCSALTQDSENAGTAQKIPVPKPLLHAAMEITGASSGQDCFKQVGYLETPAGQLKAIVTSGDEVFIVAKGQTFADKYVAVNVSESSVTLTEKPEGLETAAHSEPAGPRPSRRETAKYVEVPKAPIVPTGPAQLTLAGNTAPLNAAAAREPTEEQNAPAVAVPRTPSHAGSARYPSVVSLDAPGCREFPAGCDKPVPAADQKCVFGSVLGASSSPKPVEVLINQPCPSVKDASPAIALPDSSTELKDAADSSGSMSTKVEP